PYRINWGAGLRVYLIQDGDEIVILLCAGFKDRQNESFNIIYIMRTKSRGREF
ncbi:type II toxin-antitoxin system RelE/ParE family toxin, partial [Salmonella enterica subsp. salamae]|nr:type II toxin-antitoxin system RelE/ParE family toxin [Salmonella enterica subsp. salamae]